MGRCHQIYTTQLGINNELDGPLMRRVTPPAGKFGQAKARGEEVQFYLVTFRRAISLTPAPLPEGEGFLG